MTDVESFSGGLYKRLMELESYVGQHTGEQGIFKINVGIRVYQSLIEHLSGTREYSLSEYSTVMTLYTSTGKIEIQPVRGHEQRMQPCGYCGNAEFNDKFECVSCGAKWK